MAEPASPTLGEAPWLRKGPVAKLLAVLDRQGEEARVVGGAVRNAMLGEPPGDIDIATTALPPEVMRRAQAEGFKAVPTGIDHGTITVIVAGGPFEVTTLREDVETFGRKAVVRFGRDWRLDAERRDFTMNALSASPDGCIHDYVGGLADLAARRVRFIGEPAKRIAEDYLRILRFFRFHATYGHGDPDPAGLLACIRERAGLDRLSRERVRMELVKLLLARRAAPTLTVMADSGLLDRVLGGVPLVAGFANMVAVEAVLGLAPDAVRRLAALDVLVAEDAERLYERLRLSNAEHERLGAMARDWWRIDAAMAAPAARALLYRLGPGRYVDRVLLAFARSGAEAADESWRLLAELPERWVAPAFPVKAADFLARGLPRGKALGLAMRKAEDAWIAADFPEGAALEAIVERTVAEIKERS
jgi:poly(A) polymerase